MKLPPHPNLMGDVLDFHRRFRVGEPDGPRFLPGPVGLEPHEIGQLKALHRQIVDRNRQLQAEHGGQNWRRHRFTTMFEELVEYIDAAEDLNALPEHSLEHQLDGLIDLVYFAIGTALLQGFDFNEGWRRVHAANMTKVRRADLEIREEDLPMHKRGLGPNDVVKPAGFVPPDLSDLVRR